MVAIALYKQERDSWYCIVQTIDYREILLAIICDDGWCLFLGRRVVVVVMWIKIGLRFHRTRSCPKSSTWAGKADCDCQSHMSLGRHIYPSRPNPTQQGGNRCALDFRFATFATKQCGCVDRQSCRTAMTDIIAALCC
jgi:hypothetical protein